MISISTQLSQAIKNHDLDTIKTIDDPDLKKNRLFAYISIKHYDPVITRYLIDAGYHIDHSTFYAACKDGHLDLVKLLVFKDCPISGSSVWIATEYHNFEIIMFLLDRNRITITSKFFNDATIYNIFAYGSFKLIKLIIDVVIKQNKSIIDDDDIANDTITIPQSAIKILCQLGRLDVIKYIVVKCPLILHELGTAPIRIANEHKHYDIVRFLMKQRFPIDITNQVIKIIEQDLAEDGVIINGVDYKI
jgi:hypothetical protein